MIIKQETMSNSVEYEIAMNMQREAKEAKEAKEGGYCICVCSDCKSPHWHNWAGCGECDETICHHCHKYTSTNARKNYMDMVGEEHSGWDSDE
jgi:hypothetical protein